MRDRGKKTKPEEDKSNQLMNYTQRQQALAIIVLIGFVVGYSIFVGLMFSLSTRLSLQTITKEEYNIELSKLGTYLGIYIVFLFVLIFVMAMWMKISRVEWQKDNVLRDSHEGPIRINEFDQNKYLIQTSASCSTQIKSTKDMLKVIERSEVFKSLEKSIQSNVEGFSFEQSNFFKPMFEKEIKDLKEKLPKIPKNKDKDKEKEKEGDQQKEDKQKPIPVTTILPKNPEPTEKPTEPVDKSEMEIDFEKSETKLKEFFAENFPKWISNEQYKMLETNKLFLYYRPVLSILNVDNPKIDNEEEDDRKKNKFYGLKGMYYLLPCEEKDYFTYPERLSPLLQDRLTLRKTYFDFRWFGNPSKDIAFFVDTRLVEPINAKITDASIANAKAKALVFTTHLAVDSDQDLRDEIQDLKTDNVNLKRELDKKRDQELLRMLHDGELENQWRKAFTFGKLNATAVIFALCCLLLGIFIGMTFFSSKLPGNQTSSITTDPTGG
jgi:hypothetical protein